jgi:hypothetical protein
MFSAYLPPDRKKVIYISTVRRLLRSPAGRPEFSSARDMVASVVEEKGLCERRDGLPGMDFPRSLKYHVDF